MSDWMPYVNALIAVVALSIALFTYWRNVKIKRAEWLEKLHSKFFESPNYKRIRRIIDYQSEPEFANLQTCNRHRAVDDELCESFVDYLNFFEFIASLWKLGQLTEQEVRMLFEYYLEILRKREFVWTFIRERGFENLKELIERLPSRPIRSKEK